MDSQSLTSAPRSLASFESFNEIFSAMIALEKEKNLEREKKKEKHSPMCPLAKSDSATSTEKPVSNNPYMTKKQRIKLQKQREREEREKQERLRDEEEEEEETKPDKQVKSVTMRVLTEDEAKRLVGKVIEDVRPRKVEYPDKPQVSQTGYPAFILRTFIDLAPALILDQSIDLVDGLLSAVNMIAGKRLYLEPERQRMREVVRKILGSSKVDQSEKSREIIRFMYGMVSAQCIFSTQPEFEGLFPSSSMAMLEAYERYSF